MNQLASIFNSQNGAMLFGQLFYLIALIVILIILFVANKKKLTVTDLTLAAVFIIISVVLSTMLSVYIPIGGVNAFKVGIAQPIQAIGGVVLPTALGWISGILIDIIGLIVKTEGIPYFGFTFNSALTFLIGSLIFKLFKNTKTTTLRNVLFGFFGLLGALATALLLMTPGRIKFESLIIPLNDIIFGIQYRYFILLLVWGLIIVFILLIMLLLNYLREYNKATLYKWMIVVILIELIINITLTPMHLNVMYGIPYIASILPRIVKAIVFFPVNTIVGYILLKTISGIKR